MNSLTRRNNLHPFAEFRREMDSLFDDFFSPTRTGSETTSFWTPACEITEEKNHYLLSLDMPGIAKDDIKIDVTDNTVTVTGERHKEEEKKEQGAWHSERQYGRFLRSFTLPSGVDSGKIEADYRDGVLKLMVPKAESAKPRQIKIGGGSGFFGKLIGGETKKKEENVAKAG
jgi:HSP20 family protein